MSEENSLSVGPQASRTSPRLTVTRRAVLGAAGLGGAGALVAAAFGVGRGRGESSAPPATRTTERVVRGDLVDLRTLHGELGFGTARGVGGQLPGVLTAIAAVGSVVRRGGVLYRVDDEPVVLWYGALPMWRSLAVGAKGHDVRQLEENLRAFGDRPSTVDDSFTASTASAVRRWQGRVGLPKNGRVDLGRVVYAPAAVRVVEHRAQVGDRASGSIIAVTGTARAVTLTLGAADRDLARTGRTVTVVLPGGASVEGTVESAVRTAASGPAGDTNQLSATVGITDQTKVADLEDAPVDVNFVVGERRDVLIVPVLALLALREGGYGVEIVEGAASRIAAVRVGLFAQGKVEISGDGVSAGMFVVVPS